VAHYGGANRGASVTGVSQKYARRVVSSPAGHDRCSRLLGAVVLAVVVLLAPLGLADAGRVAVRGGMEGSAVTEGLSEWVSPHRLRPTDSDSGQLRPAQPGPAAPVPVPGVGVDGLPHLFGLPQARNAVCGMAAATGPDQVELDQAHRGPAVSDRDLVVTCPGCLEWPLPNTEFR